LAVPPFLTYWPCQKSRNVALPAACCIASTPRNSPILTAGNAAKRHPKVPDLLKDSPFPMELLRITRISINHLKSHLTFECSSDIKVWCIEKNKRIKGSSHVDLWPSPLLPKNWDWCLSHPVPEMYEDRLRSTSPHVRYMGMGQNYQDSQLGIHQCLDQCPNALPTGPTQMALPKNRGTLKNERLSITLNYISGTSPLKCPIPKNHDVTLNYRSLRFARNSGCLWFFTQFIDPKHTP
jgi:hypothetical protein